jgi:hypothetical protein
MDSHYIPQITAETLCDFSAAQLSVNKAPIKVLFGNVSTLKTIGSVSPSFVVKAIKRQGVDAVLSIDYPELGFHCTDVRAINFYTIESLAVVLEKLALEADRERRVDCLGKSYYMVVADGLQYVENASLDVVLGSWFHLNTFMANRDLYRISRIKICASKSYISPAEFDALYPDFACFPEVIAAEKNFDSIAGDNEEQRQERIAAYKAYFETKAASITKRA